MLKRENLYSFVLMVTNINATIRTDDYSIWKMKVTMMAPTIGAKAVHKVSIFIKD